MFAFNKASPLNGQLEEKQEKVLGDSPLDHVQKNFIEMLLFIKFLLTFQVCLI
jgi:hypothetical protein